LIGDKKAKIIDKHGKRRKNRQQTENNRFLVVLWTSLTDASFVIALGTLFLQL